MNISERIGHMGKELIALVAVTAVLSLGAIFTSFGTVSDGEAYGYTRMALGLVGLVGAVLIVVGNDYGKMGLYVVLAWAGVQSLYFADVPDGNYTRQLFDMFMGASSSTTINGEITEFSEIGINLVGLVMLIFAYFCRTHITHWKNRATRGFEV